MFRESSVLQTTSYSPLVHTMLPKRQRLSRREFAYLLRRGKRIHGERCSLVYIRSRTSETDTADPATKYGVVVSKKTARKAVMRHLLRRRLYAIFRQHPTPKAAYLACITRPQAASLPYAELEKEVRVLLAKIS